MIKFTHARSNENGGITGGQQGDQNGREIMTTDGYIHAKGWVVLRPKTQYREKIVKTALAIAANDNIGYDQDKRDTGVAAAKAVNFIIANITTKCSLDCSSLVRTCCLAAGIKVGDFYTGNEAQVLIATKCFEKIPFTSLNTLIAGDVLVTQTKGHTVIVTSDDSPAKEGWVKEGTKWYYYENGAKTLKKWIKTDYKWYRVGNDGAMLVGYHLVPDNGKDRPCYFDNNGALLHEANDKRGFLEVWIDK